jgi:hypothetical protein
MKILQALRAKANAFRSTLRIVETQKFLTLFEKAAQSEKDKAELFAMEGNLDNLKIWMQQQSGNYSIGQLRQQARASGVPNYSRLDKEELIRALYTD